MADFIIKDIKIPDRRTIELMRTELACVSRNECDRHCENCDLVQDVDELIVAFNEVIKFLETVTNAVQLPEGHGNMIDMNSLEDMDFESCGADDCREIKWRVSGRNHIRQIIKDALIIIPAEGGTGDG